MAPNRWSYPKKPGETEGMEVSDEGQPGFFAMRKLKIQPNLKIPTSELKRHDHICLKNCVLNGVPESFLHFPGVKATASANATDFRGQHSRRCHHLGHCSGDLRVWDLVQSDASKNPSFSCGSLRDEINMFLKMHVSEITR